MHLVSSPKMATGGLILPRLAHWDTEEDDCDRLSNRTTEYPPTVYVQIICMPLFILLCTWGNAMNVWILLTHCLPGAKQGFLLSLAFVDCIGMWSYIPLYLNENSELLGIDLSQAPVLVALYGIFLWFHYTFCYTSDWILVAFSLERLSAFRFRPPNRQRKGHRKAALLLVLGFVVVTGILTSGTLIWYYHWWINRRQETYVQPEYVAQWIRVRQQIDIAYPLIVALCLLVINLWLLIHLKRKLRVARELLVDRPKPDSETKNCRLFRDRQHNLTRMLLGCVAVYFITQLPYVVLNTLDHLSFAPYCMFSELLEGKAFWEPITTTLALLNYCTNFAVYMGVSAIYRQAAEFLAKRLASGTCAAGPALPPRDWASAVRQAEGGAAGCDEPFTGEGQRGKRTFSQEQSFSEAGLFGSYSSGIL